MNCFLRRFVRDPDGEFPHLDCGHGQGEGLDLQGVRETSEE